ncbi:macrophage colony-stimulating factor 1 [Discoglossus pictus]
MHKSTGFIWLHMAKITLWSCFLLSLPLVTVTETNISQSAVVNMDTQLKHLDEMIDNQLVTECRKEVELLQQQPDMPDYCYRKGRIFQLRDIMAQHISFTKNTFYYNYTQGLKALYDVIEKRIFGEHTEDVQACSQKKSMTAVEILKLVKEIFMESKDLLSNPANNIDCSMLYNVCEDIEDAENHSLGPSQCDCPSPIPPILPSTATQKPPSDVTDFADITDQPSSVRHTLYSTKDMSVSNAFTLQPKSSSPQEELQSMDMLSVTFTEIPSVSHINMESQASTDAIKASSDSVSESLPASQESAQANTDSSTESPGSSTESPDSSTESPGSSTESPDSSTGSPDFSTGSPDSSTGSPDSSTGSPDSSPGSPDSSTGSPDSSTGTPDSNTRSPGSSTGSPGSSTGSPVSSTESPGSKKPISENTVTLPKTTEAPHAKTELFPTNGFTIETPLLEKSAATESHETQSEAGEFLEYVSEESDLGWASSHSAFTKIRRSIATSEEISRVHMTSILPTAIIHMEPSSVSSSHQSLPSDGQSWVSSESPGSVTGGELTKDSDSGSAAPTLSFALSAMPSSLLQPSTEPVTQVVRSKVPLHPLNTAQDRSSLHRMGDIAPLKSQAREDGVSGPIFGSNKLPIIETEKLNRKENTEQPYTTTYLYIVVPCIVGFLLSLCGLLYYKHRYRIMQRQQQKPRHDPEVPEEMPLQNQQIELDVLQWG